MGFDAISAGGVLAWLMDLLDSKTVDPRGTWASAACRAGRWTGFDVVGDSLHNAELGCELIDAILERRGILDFREGVRKWSRIHSRQKGTALHDRLVYTAFNRRGWMVPNQYWVAGVLAPMAIMGKYYMIYSYDFIPPRTLGRMCAERMKKELILDNLGTCRFHRGWAEEMLPEIMGSLYDCKDRFCAPSTCSPAASTAATARSSGSRSATSTFCTLFCNAKKRWTASRIPAWANGWKSSTDDKVEAAREFWYETLMGIDESLREFF